jgi:hypothetical protein
VEISHKARWAVWGVALALAFVNVTILVAQALDLPSKLRSPPSPGPRFRAAWASHSIIAPEQPYAAESPGSNGPNSRRAQSGQKTRGAVGLSPSRASGRSRPKTASRVARAYVLRVVRGVDGSPLDEGETKWPARSRAQPRIAPRPEEPCRQNRERCRSKSQGPRQNRRRCLRTLMWTRQSRLHGLSQPSHLHHCGHGLSDYPQRTEPNPFSKGE